MKGLFFIVSAPAGTGKTTLIDMLKKEFPFVVSSVSYTTRPPRSGEKHSEDYYFVTKELFEEKIEKEHFLEHAEVFGYHYGTDKKQILEKQIAGKCVFLNIDTQGALNAKKKMDAITIFILPPSIEEIKQRMIRRNKDSLEVIERRLSWANKEIEMAQYYDYQIINDDLQTAYDAMRAILIAELHRTKHLQEKP